jgi:hypothetical protein
MVLMVKRIVDGGARAEEALSSTQRTHTFTLLLELEKVQAHSGRHPGSEKQEQRGTEPAVVQGYQMPAHLLTVQRAPRQASDKPQVRKPRAGKAGRCGAREL